MTPWMLMALWSANNSMDATDRHIVNSSLYSAKTSMDVTDRPMLWCHMLTALFHAYVSTEGWRNRPALCCPPHPILPNSSPCIIRAPPCAPHCAIRSIHTWTKLFGMFSFYFIMVAHNGCVISTLVSWPFLTSIHSVMHLLCLRLTDTYNLCAHFLLFLCCVCA